MDTVLDKIIKFQCMKSRLYRKVLKKPFPDLYRLGLIFEVGPRESVIGHHCQGCNCNVDDLSALDDFMGNARCYHIVPIIVTAYFKLLHPSCRINTDYWFLGTHQRRTLSVLFEELITNHETFEEFYDVHQTISPQWLVIDKTIFEAFPYKLWSTHGTPGLLGSEAFRHFMRTVARLTKPWKRNLMGKISYFDETDSGEEKD